MASGGQRAELDGANLSVAKVYLAEANFRLVDDCDETLATPPSEDILSFETEVEPTKQYSAERR